MKRRLSGGKYDAPRYRLFSDATLICPLRRKCNPCGRAAVCPPHHAVSAAVSYQSAGRTGYDPAGRGVFVELSFRLIEHTHKGCTASELLQITNSQGQPEVKKRRRQRVKVAPACRNGKIPAALNCGDFCERRINALHDCCDIRWLDAKGILCPPVWGRFWVFSSTVLPLWMACLPQTADSRIAAAQTDA